jgi:hypothetical protein
MISEEETGMLKPDLTNLLNPLLAAAGMLALMGLNVAVSSACRGHAWSVFAVLPLAVGQAGLLLFALMELRGQGPVPRVYLGLAFILLAVAALSFTDYMSRRSALGDDAGSMPAGAPGTR